MTISVGPISLNDLGEAFYSTPKANHLTSVPVYFDREGPCGPLLVKGQSGSNLYGREECVDQVNPVIGYSHSYTGLLDPLTGAKIPSSNASVVSSADSYLLTTALVRAQYTAAGYVARGPNLALLYSNGRVQDQVTISTEPLLDACQGAIGWRRTIIHSNFSYDPVTCQYRQAYSEVFKFFWNLAHVATANVQSSLSSFHLSTNASGMITAAVNATFDNSALSGDSYTLTA